MKSHFELTDAEYEAAFSSLLFPPNLFSHEAHLRLAYIYLRQGTLEEAIDKTRTAITRFVDHVGAEGKYNETVTVASVKLLHRMIAESSTHHFKDFIAEHPELLSDFKNIIRSYYTTHIFVNERAKREFIEPELKPL